MISPQTFSLFLLVVCILACLLSTLSLAGVLLIFRTNNAWARGLLKFAFVVLATMSGVAASLLILLK